MWLVCLPGAWISYDHYQGDDLCRDAASGQDAAELIIPFADSPYVLPLPFPSVAQNVQAAASARLPRQLWGPFYWFVVKEVFCSLNPWNKFLNVPREEMTQKFEYYSSVKYLRYVKPGGAPGQMRKLLGVQTLAYWDFLIYSCAYNNSECSCDANHQHSYFIQRSDQLARLFLTIPLVQSRAGMKLMEVWCDMFKEQCIESIINEDRAMTAHQTMIDGTE